MKFNLNRLIVLFLMVGGIGLFTSCNKDAAAPVPVTFPATSGQTLADIINSDPTLTILKAAVTRASTSTATPSLSTLLADRNLIFSFFAPTDAAFIASGIPSAAALNAFRPGQLDTLLRYHISAGNFTGAAIPSTFPNIQLQSQFVLVPPSSAVPPGLRMSNFASKRGTAFWVNNIPLTQTDIAAANGVMHKTALVVSPPSQLLWNRIDVDANLTYLKAAIQRADSGVVASATLQAALLNAGANLTVFAPNNTAMQAFLVGSITQALIARGLPAANAQAAATALVTTYGTTIITNPISIPDAPIFPPGTGIGLALATAFSPTTVKGLVVYHLLGARAFSVNIPTTATATPTLLNSAIAAHPGVTVQATFTGPGVSAATVKGLANTTASNILINPTPAPAGTSDQHYINGTLHIIDQVLRPQ